MKVIVCGDRNWSNRDLIEQVLTELPKGSLVIHGGARGADTIAGEVAKALGFYVRAYEARWEFYGRAAGPIRNRAMLKLKPDAVFAFHNDLAYSKGTKNMIKQAEETGIKLIKTFKEEKNEDRKAVHVKGRR